LVKSAVPELRIYKFWDRPIGPHPLAMFEVNLFTPGKAPPFSGCYMFPANTNAKTTEQFGAFIPWLVINRGPLSALLHPNTDDEERDHTQRATWLGQSFPLDLSLFKRMKAMRAAEEKKKNDVVVPV
jgi:aromatic ring-cleaving dioxygenase